MHKVLSMVSIRSYLKNIRIPLVILESIIVMAKGFDHEIRLPCHFQGKDNVLTVRLL